MVWIFKSDAARAKHELRTSRVEPSFLGGSRQATAVEEDIPVLTEVVVKGASAPQPMTALMSDSEIITNLFKTGESPKDSATDDISVLENFQPALRRQMRPQVSEADAFRALESNKQTLEPAELYLESSAVVDMVDFFDLPEEYFAQIPASSPHGNILLLNGIEVVDDIPPPPLPEHLGQLHRNKNTFGHALKLPAEDERQATWAKQREERGFDDTELWSLDDTFSRFILPRLKAQRQQKLEPPNPSMPLEVWLEIYDKIIKSFDMLQPEGGGSWSRGSFDTRQRAELQEGMDLFRKYFFALTC